GVAGLDGATGPQGPQGIAGPVGPAAIRQVIHSYSTTPVPLTTTAGVVGHPLCSVTITPSGGDLIYIQASATLGNNLYNLSGPTSDNIMTATAAIGKVTGDFVYTLGTGGQSSSEVVIGFGKLHTVHAFAYDETTGGVTRTYAIGAKDQSPSDLTGNPFGHLCFISATEYDLAP
ncbi:MAG: hypothetical protein KDK89_19810, partial [Alphaproteobacteria bacterium]|nr:hypothetical protein [Alphaproteobacteria bacterium]